MAPKKPPRYATEAALCAEFIAWVNATGGQNDPGTYDTVPRWTPYAETAGWDILLVAEDGTQIGVQAKLRFNLKVIDQAIPDCWDSWRETGPDFRAILIPARDVTAEKICGALGLSVFYFNGNCWRTDNPNFAPSLTLRDNYHRGGWHYWNPAKRHPLPEFVPDVIAGDSGPVQLTNWKIAALRIVATLEVRGYVTRADFKRIGIDSRRWFGPSGWLVPRSERMEHAGQYVRGPGLDFDRQHPTVYAKVLEEVRANLGDAPPHVAAGKLFEEPA